MNKINIKFLCFLTLCLSLFVACKQNNYSESPVLKRLETKAKKNILVSAHRAYHRNFPENSLASVEDAIKNEIDIVELDVRTTRDSVLVIMHDKTIDRTTTGHGEISQYAYRELMEFNLKLHDSIPTNHKIPQLEEILKTAKGKKIILLLDMKEVNYKYFYTLLKKYGMEHEVMSFIGDKEKVMEMVNIDPIYAVLPLTDNEDDFNFYCKNTKSPLQHFTNKTFNPMLMKLAHQNKQLIFVNTLWKEDEDLISGNVSPMDSVISLKPAIIQTNYPKVLLDYLREKELHEH